MTAEITIGIDGQHWPKIEAVVYVKLNEHSIRAIGPSKFTYDLAYTQIEVLVQNALRDVMTQVMKAHGK